MLGCSGVWPGGDDGAARRCFVIADAVYPIFEANPTRTRRAMVTDPDVIASFSPILFYKKPGSDARHRSIIPVSSGWDWSTIGAQPANGRTLRRARGEDTAKAVCRQVEGRSTALIPRTDIVNSLGERPISASAAEADALRMSRVD